MADISMVRGDTLKLSIDSIRSADGLDYVLSDTDVIFIDVKKSVADSVPIFRKTVTAEDYVNGTLPVTIYPNDTAGISPGDYFFDVRLFMDEKNIYTIIPLSKLRILRNVTDIPDNGGEG